MVETVPYFYESIQPRINSGFKNPVLMIPTSLPYPALVCDAVLFLQIVSLIVCLASVC